jgi:hypothetical protein
MRELKKEAPNLKEAFKINLGEEIEIPDFQLVDHGEYGNNVIKVRKAFTSALLDTLPNDLTHKRKTKEKIEGFYCSGFIKYSSPNGYFIYEPYFWKTESKRPIILGMGEEKEIEQQKSQLEEIYKYHLATASLIRWAYKKAIDENTSELNGFNLPYLDERFGSFKSGSYISNGIWQIVNKPAAKHNANVEYFIHNFSLLKKDIEKIKDFLVLVKSVVNKEGFIPNLCYWKQFVERGCHKKPTEKIIKWKFERLFEEYERQIK